LVAVERRREKETDTAFRTANLVVERTGRATRQTTVRASELACRGLDLVSFWDEAAEAVSSAVPHYMAPCWFTLDPASLLVTSHYDHGQIPELPPEWLAHEYYEDDVHNLTSVARSERGISTLHEASGGDPSRSPRWRANMQYGGDQELLVGLRTRAGEAWGVLGLYREPGERQFDRDELELLRAVSPQLATARGADCSSARRQTPRDPTLRASSFSTGTGASSRSRPGSSAGSRSSRTASGRRGGSCRP
jgi:GAF domain-containing protein